MHFRAQSKAAFAGFVERASRSETEVARTAAPSETAIDVGLCDVVLPGDGITVAQDGD